MKAGVIDIGSSSIKLIIGEAEKEGIRILESLKNIFPIGNNTFHKGFISQETINQAIRILLKYKQILDEYEVKSISVIATTAVREADNKDIFIDTVLRKTGFNVEVLTVGDVVYSIDSYLSYKLKDTYPIRTRNLLIAELGAGSLDLSVMEKGFTLMNLGLPLGTLRIKQLLTRFDGTLQENYEAASEYIENEFNYFRRTMSAIEIDDIILIDEKYSVYLPRIARSIKGELNFFELGKEDAAEILNQLGDKSPEEILRTYKIPLEIADTIPAFAILLKHFFMLFQGGSIHILETSLAEAILANALLNFDLETKYNKENQLLSIANFLCGKYDMDLNHARHVAGLSKALFEGLKQHLGLAAGDLLYLELAAYFHDIGIFIHNRAHHKHSEYIVSFLNLFRIAEEEIKVIACIARYHRRAEPRGTHLIYNSLSLPRQILVQKLAALLRIANALDRSHKQKVKKLEVRFNRSQDIVLVAHTPENFVLEKADFLDKKDSLEDIGGNKVSLEVRP
jgi:exopolyphosphatase/guanosine-5'-triphosphate,3'-diphosphate pyrophosphatase